MCSPFFVFCIYFCGMKVLQWILYFVLLGAFVWFVFFRDVLSFASSDSSAPNATEESVNDESTSNEDTYLDDEATFVDETVEPDIFTDTEFETPIDEESEVVVDEPMNLQPENETSNTEGTIDLSKKYLVIVGSFGKLSNAERMLKRVENSGNKAVITKINGLNRVVAAATNNSTIADQKRDEFTALFKERAFILEQ